MTKRAKDVAVGDVLAKYGAVTNVAIHNTEKRPHVSTVGMPRRIKVTGPPIDFKAKVVEIRTDPFMPPLYRWPNDRIELAA